MNRHSRGPHSSVVEQKLCVFSISRACPPYAFRQKKGGGEEMQQVQTSTSDATLPLFAGTTKKALVCLNVDLPPAHQLYNHTPLSSAGCHCGGCCRFTCGRVSPSVACLFSASPPLLAKISPTQQWAAVSTRPSTASLSLHSSPNCFPHKDPHPLSLLCSSSLFFGQEITS